MPRHWIEATAVIDTPAALAYSIIADYRDGHPHILPQPPFVSLDVEQGGVGAGTVIRFQMRFLGVTRTMRATISEPEPGRALVETDVDGNVITTFTVEPIEEGRTSRVSIVSEIKVSGGPIGWIQKLLISRLLGPVYDREIKQLETVATERARGHSTAGRGPS